MAAVTNLQKMSECNHRRGKQTPCRACNQCKLCLPPTCCNEKGNHRGWTESTETPRSSKRQCRSRLLEHRRDLSDILSSSSESGLSGDEPDYDTDVDELSIGGEVEVDIELDEAELSMFVEDADEVDPRTPTSIMTKVFDVIGADKSKLRHLCKKNGFLEGSIDTEKKNRNYYKAKQLISIVVERLCEIMCPGNVNFKEHVKPSESVNFFPRKMDKETQKLEENVQKPILCGDRITRVTILSLLASSYTKKNCNRVLARSADNFPASLVKVNGRIGKKRFTSSRKIYPMLAAGMKTTMMRK